MPVPSSSTPLMDLSPILICRSGLYSRTWPSDISNAVRNEKTKSSISRSGHHEGAGIWLRLSCSRQGLLDKSAWLLLQIKCRRLTVDKMRKVLDRDLGPPPRVSAIVLTTCY